MTYPKHYLVFDFETTGLDPFKDKPIEVAWAVVKDRCVIKARRFFLNYHIDIPAKAASIHGITRETIEESEDASLDPLVPLQQLLDDINATGAHVTHNGTYFDLLFLLNAFDLSDIDRKIRESALHTAHIDTAAVFKGRGLKIPRKPEENLDSYARRVLKTHSPFKYNLRAACEAHGISVTGQHRAMDDVALTHLLYQEMCLC